MKLIASQIADRSAAWNELDKLCTELENRSDRRKLTANRRIQFASLYRSACADLALADSYQLPEQTVTYLNQLVGRAHNQLYRTRGLGFEHWWVELVERVPRRLFHDNCLRLAAALFWGGFLLSAFLASNYSPLPDFAEEVLGVEQMQGMQDMYADELNASDDGFSAETMAAGFYLNHNTTIGIRCFVMGLILGIGGMFEVMFNSVFLGAAFGYMSTTPESVNFFTFVTAHGPFELTAIVLSAAAGMRLGFSIVDTNGLSRTESLLAAGRHAMPTMFAAVLLFMGAAFIEGFISPSSAPYGFKAFVAVMSTLALLGYFVVLGYSQQSDDDHEKLSIH